MSDTVFRTSQPKTDQTSDITPSESNSESKTDTTTTSEVQVLDLLVTYEQESGRPYTAEYYELGDMWNRESSLKGDLQRIEKHIKEQVNNGSLNNSTKAADKYLKTLEKKADIDTVMDSTNKRIEKLSAYIDFLDVIK